jgi:hypothetical protein
MWKLGIGIIVGAILVKKIKELNTIYDRLRNKVRKNWKKFCSVNPTECAD